MGIYARVFKNFCVEIVITEKRFKRRKRTHILLNPNSEVQIDIFAPREQEAVINPEGLTHIMFLERPTPSPEIFERTLSLHETLNKPIIVEEETSKQFRARGVSVRQLRLISHEGETLEGIKITPIRYTFKDYDPESETLSLKVPDETNPLQKAISSGIAAFTSVLSKLPFSNKLISEEKAEEEDAVVLENPMAVLLSAVKHSILIPIDPLGSEHVERMLQLYRPTILLLPESSLGQAAQLNAKLKRVVTFDQNYPKDKVAVVPRTHNDFADFDTLVASLEEWVEIPT